GGAQYAFGFAVLAFHAGRDRTLVGAAGDGRVRFTGHAAPHPGGDHFGPRFGARFDRMEVVGLHQLRVGVDEARPVRGLGTGTRGGEFGDHPVLARVVDSVDGEAVDRRHHQARFAGDRGDLLQVFRQDLGIFVV